MDLFFYNWPVYQPCLCGINHFLQLVTSFPQHFLVGIQLLQEDILQGGRPEPFGSSKLLRKCCSVKMGYFREIETRVHWLDT